MSFIIDSPYFDNLTKPLSSRSITTTDEDELELINSLSISNTSKIISILNKDKINNDLIEKILDFIIKSYETQGDDIIKNLIELNKIDNSLPFITFNKLLKFDNVIIKLQSSYILTLLILSKSDIDDSIILNLFEVIDSFIKSQDSNLINFASQLLIKLLSIKSYRNFFWSLQSKYLPSIYQLLITTKDLQLRYNFLLSIWLLTFNQEISKQIPILYKDLIKNYLIFASDSIKEKITRLSISTLLNFLKIDKNDSIIKKFLFENSIDIFKKLNERKWADEDLKNDLTEILDILNNAVVSLTTFDEYEIELNNEIFNWSPPHKSEEFWIDNIDKFKSNNFKLFKKLIDLLVKDTTNLNASQLKQFQLNQTIICHDLGMIVKYLPETIKFLDLNQDLKYTIMNLMNSTNSDVKYEALKTTQILVSSSFAS